MISLREIKKSFTRGNSTKTVIDGISFDCEKHSFTTIFGPNGCGKSTLLNIITGLDKDYGGSLTLSGVTQHEIGYVFQDYRRSLLPWRTVRDNILFPLQIRRIPLEIQETRLQEVLKLTGLSVDLLQPVYSLSGGQAQAVCIMRALIIEPKLLILDEPFAALDYEKTLSLRSLISLISKQLKLTVVFISHDLDEAILLGDRVVFLSRYPARVIKILDVELPYPREPHLVTSTQFNE